MLIIEHLTKQYKGSNKGVTDLSLHVEPGDIYAFIGHNGAGKTTTLKCVAGIQDYDAGTIRIGEGSQGGSPGMQENVCLPPGQSGCV
jgi:ABC-2 type transport system ATP-binding protein